MLLDEGKSNEIKIGKGVSANGFVRGSQNSVIIGDTDGVCNLDIKIIGDNNSIIIGDNAVIKGLSIHIGSYTRAFYAAVSIGDNFSIEAGGTFFVYNSGNKVEISDNCMFSNNVVLRTGEAPHLIFDLDSGRYIDEGGHIVVGTHSWVGEHAYLTKRARIGPESIVAACAVVTTAFEDQNVVIGGNPAKVVKRGIQWVRNRSSLEEGSKFKESYLQSVESFRSRKGE